MAKTPTAAPWLPFKYEDGDIGTIKAWSLGEASPEQQRDAFRLVVERICGTYDMSYRPDSQRDSDFAEGKRHVGNSIIKLTKMKVSKSNG